MQYKHFSTKFIYLNNQGTLKAQLNYLPYLLNNALRLALHVI